MRGKNGERGHGGKGGSLACRLKGKFDDERTRKVASMGKDLLGFGYLASLIDKLSRYLMR